MTDEPEGLEAAVGRVRDALKWPGYATAIADDLRLILATVSKRTGAENAQVDVADRIERLEAALREAAELFTLLVAYDEEASPNGLMDCVDNSGHPYQSASMAGLVVHARMFAKPYDHAAAVADFRAALGDCGREGA